MSWIEASEDILSLLLVRNIIMYSVVSAILVVASFGIYNTISTIVMEDQDITFPPILHGLSRTRHSPDLPV